MFKMALLRGILLFSVITVTCQALLVTTNVSDTPSIQPGSQTVNTSDEIMVLKVKMAKQQNTKFAKRNKRLKMKIVELEKLASRENQTSPSNNSETGSIFTRWGRRDCPSDVSQLVYSGITGGTQYTQTEADYVCLPPDPSLNEIKFAKASSSGYMYGAEYEDPMPIENYDVPCAVCRTSQFSTVLMIPAKSECYSGWQEAYHGELASAYYLNSAASQYVCLDDNPQTSGTNDNNNGKLVYPVRVKCGALPCPPYEENARVTCVVCLK